MHRTRRVLALTVSAALGVVGGVVGGLLLDRSPEMADPLGLGIPMVNQPCSGDSILMLSWGDAGPALGTGVGEAPQGLARYLDTHHSCRTFYTPRKPHYVTYLGPFGTRHQACRRRMTERYAGDVVTRLHEGNVRQVECTCFVRATDAPDLRTGGETGLGDIAWIRSLQRMLHDMHLMNEHLTGAYDDTTQRAVEKFQTARGLNPSGEMTSVTWPQLLTAGCRLYTS